MKEPGRTFLPLANRVAASKKVVARLDCLPLADPLLARASGFDFLVRTLKLSDDAVYSIQRGGARDSSGGPESRHLERTLLS